PDLTGSPDLAEGPDMAAAGPRCHAVLFDGVHAMVTAPAQNYMNPPGAVTVEAWVYVTKIGPDEQVVAGHWGDVANMTASYVLVLDPMGHPSFKISKLGADENLVATAASAVPLNKWTHVAGVFDPISQMVYAFNNGADAGM